MTKKKDLRLLTNEELGDNPLLLRRIAEWKFSEGLHALLYLMFGHRWERYGLVKEFVQKFVRVNAHGEHVFKNDGLMWKGFGKTSNPMSQQLYTLLPPYIPEIRAKLRELQFLALKMTLTDYLALIQELEKKPGNDALVSKNINLYIERAETATEEEKKEANKFLTSNHIAGTLSITSNNLVKISEAEHV